MSDEAVRAVLAREVERLRGSRRFGLVFDRHLPEAVRLPTHPIRKGVAVGRRDDSTAGTWRVTGFTGPSRAVALLSDGSEAPVEQLVVIREFGDPVYPGLRSREAIARGLPTEP